ncbi:MAG TPA: hypothetical protein P5038_11945 [Candidatus Paceibacterota bacterium]|nr:hypothetical protein [Candidatus Paceibacterota bacterium]HRT57331.1 hypothetical protein [Candidatus Paceibacterota bacterium]
MKRWTGRLILLGVLGIAAFYLWRWWFPDPELEIRRRLQEVAQLASFGNNEDPLAKASNAHKLTTYFSSDATILVEGSGHPQMRISGQQELLQTAMAARQNLASLKVEFLDVTVALASGKQAAQVNLTARARVPGERDELIAELNFFFKKIEGDWLITRVETVRTLSAGAAPGGSPPGV